MERLSPSVYFSQLTLSSFFFTCRLFTCCLWRSRVGKP